MGKDWVLWSEEELVGFDLETTGADVSSDSIVSFALVTFEGPEPTRTLTSLVDPGQPITPEAEAVHGISQETAREMGMELGKAVSTIVDTLIDASERSVPVVGMNVCFDLTIVDTLANRIFGAGLLERGFAAPVLDVLVLDRHVDKYRKGSRRLSSLCEHYGVTQKDAHEANDDVRSCVDVLRVMAQRFPEIGAADPAVLSQNQVLWHHEWATEYSRWRVQQGKPALHPRELRWPLMREDIALAKPTQLSLAI